MPTFLFLRVEPGTDRTRPPTSRPVATYPRKHLWQMRQAAAFLSNSFPASARGDLLTLPGDVRYFKRRSRRESIGAAAAKQCFVWREDDGRNAQGAMKPRSTEHKKFCKEPQMQRKRRSSFSDEQLRQLKSANENLRRLNHAALSQLQHIANSYLTTKQYRAASDSFEILALRMNSVVQFRDGIITAARAEPDVIRVVFGTI